MSNMRVNIKKRNLSDFPVWADPVGREILKDWLWFGIGCEPRLSWEENVVKIRTIIAAIADKALDMGQEVWLSLYAAFTGEALIPVAAALIPDCDCPRFYMAETENKVGGPGYVCSFLNVEYKPGSIEKIFEEVDNEFVGTGNHLSVYITSDSSRNDVLSRYNFEGGLYSEKLREDAKKILEHADCLMSPENDFEFFDIGIRKNYLDTMREILRLVFGDISEIENG